MSNKINFFTEEVRFSIKQKKLIREWILKSILSEGFDSGNINIILCSDAYLYEMNMKYLRHDTLTDIITFDYSEGKTISGDLFLSIERIQENAKTYSKNVSEELHRVIIHGVLHLCGYGDKSTIEKEKMTNSENTYLSLRPFYLKNS